jgi:hypothetical protein
LSGGRRVTEKVKTLILLLVTFFSVILMTGGWWIAVPGQGGQKDRGDYIPPPLVFTTVIVFVVQALAWNRLCRFPGKHPIRVFLGVGFPLATTLVVLALGNFIDLFLPAERDAIFNVAAALVIISRPALIVGGLLFLICCAFWFYSDRA